MGRAQVEMAKAQESAIRGGRRPSEKQLKDQFRRSIEIIKEGYKLKSWQFLIESQINGQVGVILFSIKDFDEAEPYLRNSFLKNWMAQAMLGVTYFRKKKYDKMKEVFERGVKGNKKEALMWALYAWCLWKNKDRTSAIEVLIRAKEHSTDERIEKNLQALKNNKKMKMEGWKENWYQFHLAKPPVQKMHNPYGGKMNKKGIYR
jgi:tetratricopeptide (TPR) repeat protein